MSRIKRTITLLLILSLLGADVAPAVAAVGDSVRAPEQSDEIIPPFPEDADHDPVDWSAIDWDRKVVLPEDERDYFKKMQEVVGRKGMKAFETLKKPEEPMHSDRIMAVYQVPLDVQERVRAYRIDLMEGLSPEKAKERKKFLREDLKRLLESTGRLPTVRPEEPAVQEKESLPPELKTSQPSTPDVDLTPFAPIDLSGKKPLDSPVETVLENPRVDADVKIEKVIPAPAVKNSLEEATLESMREQHLESPARTSDAFLFDSHPSVTRISEMLWDLVGVLPARAGKPLIEAYDGIEKNPVDRALLYISSQQQTDGGLSGPDRYMVTAQAALLLTEARLMNNDQYQAMVSYLKTTSVETVREKAMKARLLFSLNDQSYIALLDEIVALQHGDGGFGLTPYHPSDVLTSLEVAWAMWATQYYKKDAKPLARALVYAGLLVNKDGAVRYSADGPASIYLTAKTLQYFVLFNSFQISAIGGADTQIDISIRQRIDAMLAFLKTSVDPATGSLAGTREVSDLAHVLEVFQIYNFEIGLQKKIEQRLVAAQKSNGSFDDSILATVAALGALSKPDFEITSITVVPSPGLEINGVVYTGKELTVGQMGKLDVIVKNKGTARGTPKYISGFVDDVLLEGNGPVVVPRALMPGESMVIGYSMPIAMAFTGEAKFEFFVDAAEQESRSDNNWKAQTFSVTDPESRPALPRYFVTQKAQLGHDENPESPAHLIPPGVRIPAFMINYRKKADAKRKNIVVLHRPKGVTEVGRDSDGKPIPWFQDHIAEKYDGFFLANMTEPYLPEDAEYEINVGVADLNGKVHMTEKGIIIKLTSDEKKYLGTVSGSLTIDSDLAPGVNLRGNGIYQNTDEKGNFSATLSNGTGGVWADHFVSPWLDELVTVFPIPNGGEEKNVRVFTRLKKDTTPPVLEKPFVMPQWGDNDIKTERVVTLVARASDAVYVKNATFWYWDPVKKDWEFIVSKDAPFNRDGISIDIMHKWYVSSEMIGKGYKIKAVVQDYHGNASQIVESNEFEIFDGAPPKDVTPPTVDALELRYMREGKIKNQQEATIIASASDNVFVTRGEFWYWDPKKNDWISLGSTANQWGQQWMNWIIPKELLGSGYKIKSIVYDDAGNASQAKEFGPFEIISGSKPGGIVKIEGLTDGKWFLGEKKTITWDLKGASPIKVIDAARLYYNSPEWQIEHIKSSIDVSKVTSLEYAMRLSGHLVGTAKIQLYVCDTLRNCATVDSEPFQISDPSPPPPYPWNKEQVFDLSRTKYPLYRLLNETFQNSDGSREYVYTEYDSTNDGTQYIRIMYRKFANGSWQEPVPLVQDLYKAGVDERITISDAHAVRGPRGEIHVDFLRTHGSDWKQEGDNYEVFYLRFENGAVQERRQISADDTMSRYQRMAVDSRGNMIIVWNEGYSFTRGSGINILKTKTVRNGAWSDVTNFTDSGVWASFPSITMDNDLPVIMYNQDGDYLITRARDGWASWERAIPITPRTVPKSAFASVLDSQEKLNTLVDQDSSDQNLYRWKPSILIRRNLEQATKSFQSQQAILDIWYYNQYAVNEYEQLLFAPSPGVYDLFSRKGGPEQQWRYTVRFLRVKPNFNTSDPGVQSEREIVGIEKGTDVRSYRVLMDRDSLYNVFYIKMMPVPWGSIDHPYHFYFDGVETWHHAMAASPLLHVSDNITAVSERNDVLSYHFGDGRFVNTADYSAVKKYRLTQVSPANNQKLPSGDAKLSWTLSGGTVDSYTVLAGTDPGAMKPVAEKLVANEVALLGLEGAKTYSWQVLGKKGDKVIASAIRQFTTPAAIPDIEIEDEAGALNRNLPITFPVVNVGASSEKTLLIRNLGNAVLNLTENGGVRIEGVDAKDFAITKQSDGTVDMGKATTLVIASKPLSSGAKSAELVFATNDPDEGEIRIKMTSSAISPILSISVDGTDVAVGGTHALDNIVVGTSVDVTVTLKNKGDSNLALFKPQGATVGGEGGSETLFSLIQFSGIGAGNAKVLKDPATPILPGGETSFVVRVEPKKAGDSSFGIGIYHNDKKIASPATVNFSARAIEPDITLVVDGRTLTGSRENIGRLQLDDIRVGDKRSINFEILNKGDAELKFTPSIVGATDDQEIALVEDNSPIPLIFPRPYWKYTLTITPKTGGSKSFSLRVASNDPDQPQTGIDIAYTALNPEIKVVSDSKEIQSGSTVSLGDVSVGVSKTLTFEIENVGDTDLSLTDTPPIVVGGSDAQDCSVTVPGKTVLPKGEKTSFSVSYAPPQSKDRALCTFTIKNTDADEGVFVINLDAAVRDPELDVAYDDASLPSGGAVILGETGLGVPLERTFTLKNAGNEPLRFEGQAPFVSLEGAGASAFTVASSIESGMIDAGKTATVTVRFASADRGEKSATLLLRTNDRDEGRFTIELMAGAHDPAIGVYKGESVRASGSSISFGNTVVSSRSEQVITVSNNGDRNLIFKGGAPFAVLSGNNASDFALDSKLPLTLKPGEKATVGILFAPKTRGAKIATLTILSNDRISGAFTLELSGTGTVPKAEIKYNDNAISATDEVIGPTVAVGQQGVMSFTVKSAGTADLRISGPPRVAISGADAKDFSITQEPLTPLEPGVETSFTVTFSPITPGDKRATLTMITNDRDAPTFSLAIASKAIQPDFEMVDGSNKPIKNGDTIDLGIVSAGATAKAAFRLKNSGTAPFTVITGPSLKVLEGNAGDFEFAVTLANRTFQPNTEQDIVLKARPKRKGAKRAEISFTTDDPKHPEMIVNVIASASEPDLDVLSSTRSLKLSGMIWNAATIDPVVLGKSGETTFTLSNIGTAPLIVDKNFGIIQAEDDQTIEVVRSPDVIIDPGAKTTLVVRFTPKSAGKKEASISISSNDPDDGQVSIPIVYTAIEPDITPLYKGEEVSTSAPLNAIDFGGLPIGQTSSQTVTIKNSGDADLLFRPVSGISITGDDDGVFTLADSSLDSIKPGEQREIIIRVAPRSFAPTSAVLVLETNDRDEGRVTISLRSFGIAPILSLTSRQKDVKKNDTVRIADVVVGANGETPFTIENIGEVDLVLTDVNQPIKLEGVNADEFSIIQPIASLMKPKEKTDFTVRFTPLSLGEKKASFTIESTNHWDKALTVNLVGYSRDPELDAVYDDASLPSGGAVILGETGLGVTLERTFTLKNSGNEPLRFEGQAPFVSLEGAGSSAFTVTSSIESRMIDAGKTATVTVRFASADRGEKSATLLLRTNDRDEGRFTIELTAGAHDPAISVSGARQSFDDTEVSALSSIAYTVTNEGDRDLVFSGTAPYAILSGDNAADFAVVSQLPARLKQGESAAVSVSFVPRTGGAKRATLTIASNDRTNPTFTIDLSGTGIVPSARFSLGDSVLVNGGTITGPEVFVGASSTVTVLLKNAGKASLLISGPPRVAINGDDASEFALASEPVTPLSADGETSFAVTLQPRTFGKKNARLSLRTNDPNAASVTFNITFEAIPISTGTGLTAEYYSDSKLNSLVYRKLDTKIDFDWKDLSPSADLYKNDFSVRWTGELEPQYTGRYELVSRADDGIKVTVDGKTLIDDWNEHTVRENRASVDLIQGKRVPIAVEYFEGTRQASAQLLWKTPKGIEEVIPQAHLYPTEKPDLIPDPAGNGKGLTAEYFADPNLKLLALRRTDPTVNFRWDFGAPDEAIPSSGFSARWKGRVTPRYSGQYTFITKSDDGVRLSIGGKKIIDDWNKRPTNKAETRTATIDLEKGKAVDIALEYFDDTGYATARLYWKTPTGIEEIIPQSQLSPTDAADVIPSPLGAGTGLSGEYFNDTEFKAMVLRRTDPRVQFTWKYDAPHPDLGQSGFSVQWTGFIEPRYTGTYTFTTKSDEGVRLRVNNTSVIDTWGAKEQNKTLMNTGTIALEQGRKYPIELSYMDDAGYATMRLLWETPYGVSEVVPTAQLYASGKADVIPTPAGRGTGLKGEYFKDTELKESTLTRTDKTVNFRWEFGSPDVKIGVDRYSARWAGQLEPRYTGRYTFTTKTDDGVRLMVNGEKVIDDWNARPLKTNTGTIDLVAGQKVDITMEYFDDTGYATARLYWTTPYGLTDFIPQSQMYPQ